MLTPHEAPFLYSAPMFHGGFAARIGGEGDANRPL